MQSLCPYTSVLPHLQTLHCKLLYSPESNSHCKNILGPNYTVGKL